MVNRELPVHENLAKVDYTLNNVGRKLGQCQ